MVHGDDFTALGTAEGLDKYESAMSQSVGCKLRGRLGEEESDLNEVRVLNRILTVTSNGLMYEADPRHVELLGHSLGPDIKCNSAATPGNQVASEDPPVL